MNAPLLKAVIFDMDGLLIDSEPYWREAMKTIFKEVGIVLTEEKCAITMGFRIDEVVEFWHSRYPWADRSIADVTESIVLEVRRLIIEKAEAMPGVEEILQFFESRNITMALASSSPMILIDATVEKLKLKDRLTYVHSAEFEDYGKPHPQVFITTAEKLGFDWHQCLVFEDSVNGAIAGKAARMKVVAVPEPHNRHLSGFGIANLKLDSLLEFGEPEWQALNQ